MDDADPRASPSPPSMAMNHFERATLAASTDMVRLLFGVPGACWGSFVCSHARIPGRMYAITTSVLFYSNVLGFERRLCLNFSDIVAISLHRTTSLRFELANDEVYIFRSFDDRQQVLGLLAGLRRLSTKDGLNSNGAMVSPQLRPRSETSRTVLLDADHQQEGGGDDASSFLPDANNSSIRWNQGTLTPSNHDDDQLLQSPSTVQVHRERAHSDSVVRWLGFEETALTKPDEDRGDRSMMAIHEEHRRALNHAMSAPLPDSVEMDPQTAWELEKSKSFTYENTGVEDVRLDCTLDDFFELFLADKAPHSFRRFQSEVIADKDTTISDWQKETEGVTSTNFQVYGRKLTFTHPIKSSIGPSEARTQRSQVLKRFSTHGMILTNSTQVTGIPAADCFRADDFWIIEANDSATILISARFAPRFHKRTMLKGLIERSIKRETTEWFRLYFDMVRTALEDRVKSGKGVVELHQTENRGQHESLAPFTAFHRIYLLLLLLIVVLLFAICALAAIQALQTFKMIKLLEVHAQSNPSYSANGFCARQDSQ